MLRLIEQRGTAAQPILISQSFIIILSLCDLNLKTRSVFIVPINPLLPHDNSPFAFNVPSTPSHCTRHLNWDGQSGRFEPSTEAANLSCIGAADAVPSVRPVTTASMENEMIRVRAVFIFNSCQFVNQQSSRVFWTMRPASAVRTATKHAAIFLAFASGLFSAVIGPPAPT
jgi:hypothetical protein